MMKTLKAMKMLKMEQIENLLKTARQSDQASSLLSLMREVTKDQIRAANQYPIPKASNHSKQHACMN